MDDFELSSDELEALLQEDQSSIEDVLKTVLLDKKSRKRIWVHLEDKDGDQVDLDDMIKELVKYISDELNSEKENQVISQIVPLMTQAVVSALGEMVGPDAASFFLSNPNTRMTIIYMMLVSFMLYKVVQAKELTINTSEEDVDEMEIAEIDRRSKATTATFMSRTLGISPKEMLRHMVNEGELTEEDLEDLVTITKERRPNDREN